MLDGEGVGLDYNVCEIAGDEIYLGKDLANLGSPVARSFGDRKKALTLPDPVQFINTVVTDCNSEWHITGHTDLDIRGNKIGSGCLVDVPGIDTEPAALIVDFGVGDKSCMDSQPYSVELEEGIMRINGDQDTIVFGKAFKNIFIIMSPCDDVVRIKKTYDDTAVVSIVGGAGNGT